MSDLKRHLTPENVMLYGFVLVANAASAIYSLSGTDANSFDLLHRAGLLYVVGYWLLKDIRKRGVNPPYCPGVLVVVAGFIFLPYYLFKTRGRKAFATAAIFLAAYVLSSLLGAIVALVFFGIKFD